MTTNRAQREAAVRETLEKLLGGADRFRTQLDELRELLSDDPLPAESAAAFDPFVDGPSSWGPPKSLEIRCHAGDGAAWLASGALKEFGFQKPAQRGRARHSVLLDHKRDAPGITLRSEDWQDGPVIITLSLAASEDTAEAYALLAQFVASQPWGAARW